MVRVLRCGVRGHTFGLDLAAVRGVGRADAGPPAASLAELLGLVEDDDTADRVVTVDAPGGPVPLRIDRVFPAAAVPPDAARPMPRLVGDTAFPTVLRLGDELVPLLDPTALVTGRPAHARAADPWAGRRTARSGRWNRLLLLPLTDADLGDRPWAAGLPAGVAEETVDAAGLVPVAGAADRVRGVLAWRGGVIAVVDLPARLSFTPVADGRGGRVVVVFPAASGEPVGLLVRRGVRLLKLPLPHLRSDRRFPGGSPAVTGCVELESTSLGLLDPNVLFAAGCGV